MEGNKFVSDPNQHPNPYPQQPQPQIVYVERQKKKKWPWLVLVPVVLFGGCAIAVAGSDSDNTDKVSDAASAAVDGVPAVDNGPTWAGKTGDDTGALAGQTVDRNGVVTTSTALVPYENSFQSLLCTTVTIQNNTGKNQSFGVYDWDLLDPSGTIRSATFGGDGPRLSSGETAPGGTTSGEVCFDQAPGNPSGEYVVLFEKSFSFSTDRIGWVNTL